MTIAEKISKFIEMKGMSLREFARLATIPSSNLSDFLNGNRKATLSFVKRAAGAMGTTVDFLVDDGAGWPPPTPDQRTHLTAAEFRVLELARECDPGDLEYGEARRRLMLRGYVPVAGRPEEPKPTGPDMPGAKKDGPGSNPRPGQKRA